MAEQYGTFWESDLNRTIKEGETMFKALDKDDDNMLRNDVIVIFLYLYVSHFCLENP